MPLERSVVYLDYYQTMHLLRAARNRVINTLNGRAHDPVRGAECRRLCEEIYDRHLEVITDAVQHLRYAVETLKDYTLVKTCLKDLNRFNRQTVRITRLFEQEMDENHEQGDEENSPPARDPTVPLPLTGFCNALANMNKQALVQPRAPRPRTPLNQ